MKVWWCEVNLTAQWRRCEGCRHPKLLGSNCRWMQLVELENPPQTEENPT